MNFPSNISSVSYLCFRDTLVVAVINGATSIFAGFVVFSFLGYLSYELEEPIEDVATSGSYFNIITRNISIDVLSYQESLSPKRWQRWQPKVDPP